MSDSNRSVSEMTSLEGRVALVTGGAGHIGRAVGGAYLEMGASVALLDVDEGSLKRATDGLQAAYGAKVMGITLDVADDDALRNVPGQVASALGGLDIVFNNAAFAGDKDMAGWAVPFAEQSVDAWRAALDVNLTAAFSLSQAAAPLLAKGGKGAIINMASIYGVGGPDNALYEGTTMGNPAAYGASKGGLIQLTRYLATTLAPAVRANAISPGGLYRGQDAKFVKRYEDRTPMGRMGTPEDMIGAAVYLASDLSAYVTGQNILVDGGWSAW